MLKVKDIKEMADDVRYLRNRYAATEAADYVNSDWRFAAAVIDRLCLYLFILVTASSACGILLSAPHTFEE